MVKKVWYKSNKEKKVIIINLFLFVLLVFSMIKLNHYMQEINYELQYKDYLYYQNNDIKLSDINITNDSVKIKDHSESINIGAEVLIPLGLALIFTIENLFTIFHELKRRIRNPLTKDT